MISTFTDPAFSRIRVYRYLLLSAEPAVSNRSREVSTGILISVIHSVCGAWRRPSTFGTEKPRCFASQWGSGDNILEIRRVCPPELSGQPSLLRRRVALWNSVASSVVSSTIQSARLAGFESYPAWIASIHCDGYGGTVV